MIIRLLPNQIPVLWPAIKYAVTNVERVSENERPLFLNKLLASLLNDKSQCFVRMSENRQLQSLAITMIKQDSLTGVKILSIECLYSFEKMGYDELVQGIELIRSFAKSTECKRVTTRSSNERVFEIANQVGFVEQSRTFSMEV